ncbi:ATP-dependent DNA helicase DDX11-like [Littorina saxatilis]|uniref:Helicase ATP-binding domain-containing protein n=1 Tax=Littorina saxatilis TaxID=31220 RepID=A0AAN9B121_9CAEN
MDSFEDDDDALLAEMDMDSVPDKKPMEENHTVNFEETETVTVPDTFPFPFEPYDIQQSFMRQLYLCLQTGKVGIFESPTGTGKSLSLICGALKWLRDFQDGQKREVEAVLSGQAQGKEESSTGDTDWVTAFTRQKQQEETVGQAKREQELIAKRESRLKTLGSSSKVCRGKRKLAKLDDEFSSLMQGASTDTQKAFSDEMEGIKRQRLEESSSAADDDSGLIPDDYNSDEEKATKDKEDDEEEGCYVTKIYYCSRTHSQLAQFVREIIKSPFGDDTRVISLGSRQNLCINESVRKLKSTSLINDRCLELQQKKSKSKPGCPFRKQELLGEFADRAMLQLCDIEQLVTLGRQTKTCPYYGSRLAVPAAEVVVLPYNTLLHKATREASGVRLGGNIVIVDEAHNLLETINNVHSVEVTGAQLARAFSQLKQYEAKYRSRLKAKNLMYVKQILFVLSCLLRCLGGKTDVPADKQNTGITDVRLLTINNFLFEAKFDNLNLFKVVHYCRQSQISKKLNGFVEKYQVPEVVQAEKNVPKLTATSGLSTFLQTIGKGPPSSASKENAAEGGRQNDRTAPVLKSPLMHIEGFLLALTTANDDGRVVISRQTLLSASSIKFLLLNPAVHFADVLQEARAVIVAGGTMQPISEFKDQLFHAAGLPSHRIMEFSCGHVVAPDHLLALTLAVGPTGVPLDFTYQARDSPRLLDELGRVLINVCSVVPGGVVIFFPSYDYEQRVSAHWQQSGVLARLEAKKKIFREPKNAVQVEHVLSQYSSVIQKCRVPSPGSPTGAVLMCVVGGKMSEGINFSDELGRCVLMVGMPYPNIKSPELKEKMDYLNANFPRDEKGRQAGQVHYENLCMKAVNQSIGRAIRHKEDYAAIILADQRYARPSVTSKLPTWISQQTITLDRFPPAVAAISKFFGKRREGSQR